MPPGPRAPAFVQTLRWIFRPEAFMRSCAERYGDTFTVRLGPQADVVFMSHPSAISQVLQGSPDAMNMGDINGLFRPILGHNSLLLLDGEEHMRQHYERQTNQDVAIQQQALALTANGEPPPAQHLIFAYER